MSIKNKPSGGKPVIIFLGPQGSGKGTQAQILIKKYGFGYVETGQLLRNESKKNTTLGRQIKKTIDNGKLVPSWVAQGVVRKAFLRSKNKAVIIDGSPRQLIEAKMLEKTIASVGRGITLVFWFYISPRETFKRLLLRGRNDDTKEGIKRRLAWSQNKVTKVFAYYSKRYSSIRIQGEQSVAAVNKDIVKILKSHEVVK